MKSKSYANHFYHLVAFKKKRKLTIQIFLLWIFFLSQYYWESQSACNFLMNYFILTEDASKISSCPQNDSCTDSLKKIDRKLFFYVPYKDCFLGLLCKSLLRLKFCWVIFFFFNSVDSSKEWIIFVQVIPGMYYSVALQRTMLLFTESDISISVL